MNDNAGFSDPRMCQKICSKSVTAKFRNYNTVVGGYPTRSLLFVGKKRTTTHNNSSSSSGNKNNNQLSHRQAGTGGRYGRSKRVATQRASRSYGLTYLRLCTPTRTAPSLNQPEWPLPGHQNGPLSNARAVMRKEGPTLANRANGSVLKDPLIHSIQDYEHVNLVS